jgi:hypothetical protein
MIHVDVSKLPLRRIHKEDSWAALFFDVRDGYRKTFAFLIGGKFHNSVTRFVSDFWSR